jgi:hypothetical protein
MHFCKNYVKIHTQLDVIVLSKISKGFVHISLHNLCKKIVDVSISLLMHFMYVSLFLEINSNNVLKDTEAICTFIILSS